MNNITDPRAKFWGNIAKYGFLMVFGFLVAPFVWLSIEGLAGLIIGSLIIGATWALRPFAYSIAANTRLLLIKKAASINPVETLQEEYRKKTIILEERRIVIAKFNAANRDFADKVADIANKYGKQDPAYIRYSNDLVNLKKVYENRCSKWNIAHAELEKFAEGIERANMVWQAAQAAAASSEASGLSEDEFFSKLKTEVALDTIRNSYNEALASLDSEMIDIQPAKQIENEKPAINVTNSVSNKQNV